MGQKIRVESVDDKNPMSSAELQKLLDMIRAVKYGSITVIIQDGRVIQIDKNEKLRLR